MSGLQGWRELICRAWNAVLRGSRAQDATNRGPDVAEDASPSSEDRDTRAIESKEHTLRQAALDGARADDGVRMVFAKALTTTPVGLGVAWCAGGLPAALLSLAGTALLAALFYSAGRRIRLARRLEDLSDSDDRDASSGR